MTGRRARGESGETLAEIIVTVAIVGLAVVALVGALATGISASAGHRQHASGDTIVRSVAEALKDRTVPLDPNGSYPSSLWSSTVDTTGFSVVVSAKCLNSGDLAATTITDSNFGTCNANTSGLQLVTVTATSTNGKGEAESVSILKRRKRDENG
jgi:hypothetical protein